MKIWHTVLISTARRICAYVFQDLIIRFVTSARPISIALNKNYTRYKKSVDRLLWLKYLLG